MSIEIKVPVLPESVADATMLSWHKQVGDVVRRDESLVDIETEKVVLEVPATMDGVLSEITKNEGDTVVADEVIGILEPQEISDANVNQSTDIKSDESDVKEGENVLSPSVRRLVSEHDIDPAQIPGTGKDGRILKEDVLKYFQDQVAPDVTPTPVVPDSAAQSGKGERVTRSEPMTRLRQTIANRLVHAQQNAALLTTFNEVNLQAVMDLRRKYRDKFEEQHGVRLGMMSFFIKASIEGLKRFPIINAYMEDNNITYHDYYDVGIAAASPRGLVVPVIRSCEEKSFAGLETAISGYGKKAHDGTLSMDDLTGGTFTITNGGVFGSLLSTPIINPPQSAILGMHKIQERPIAEDGEVKIRPMMYLALSYDHRIIDGAEAVRFLVTVKESLEDPARLLLEV